MLYDINQTKLTGITTDLLLLFNKKYNKLDLEVKTLEDINLKLPNGSIKNTTKKMWEQLLFYNKIKNNTDSPFNDETIPFIKKIESLYDINEKDEMKNQLYDIYENIDIINKYKELEKICLDKKNTKNFLNISFVSDKIFTEKIILYRKLEIEKKLKFIISTLTYQKYMKMNQMYLNVFRDEIIVENKSGVNIKLQNMLINQIAITTEVLQSEIIDKNTMLICKTIDKYNFLIDHYKKLVTTL